MATPNADRLRGIGQWDPSANDATSDVLGAIKTELDSVADLTESVATNLGSAIKGSTAEAVTASLDALGKKVRRHSEDIGVIVEARKEALDAGREAQNKNIEIQQELAEAQARYDSVVKKEPYLQAEMRALRTLDADHAKAENQAITALSTLRERTAAAIQRIPALGGEETGSSNGDEPGRRRSGDRQSSGGSDSRRRSGNGGTGGDGSGSGQNGSGAGGSGSRDAGDAGGSGGSASGPIRSATKWSATVPDPSAGSSGSVSPGGDGGLALQRSHFTVHQTGDVFQGAARPSILHSPSVHNPAAAAAAASGGAAVAGYKAYQAVRAARAASQSGTEARANGAAARGVGMARGVTTAARGASATSTKGAAAKGALARGGASGVARPAAASARSGGIVRGATTAQRAVSQAPARGSGIVKGATTASRASVPNAPQGSSGGFGRTGAGSKAARSGVGALTARGAQTGAGASSSARGSNLGRGNAARGAAASRGNGSAGSVRAAGSVRGSGAARGGTGLAGAARGTGAAAKNAAVQRAGSAGAGGAGAARGNVAGLRASTGGPGAKSAGLPASGPKNGMFKQGLSPRPAGSVGKGGIVWRSAPDAQPASATVRAVAGLAAGRRRDGEEDARQSPQGPSQASDYEQGREVTFLEAGTWQCGDAAAWQQGQATRQYSGQTESLQCGDAATWQQGQATPQHNKGPQHDGAENF